MSTTADDIDDFEAHRADCVKEPKHYERLDALNDELHVIRRLFERPPGMVTSELLDVMRMAIQYTHSRLMELSLRMRRDHIDNKDGK